MTVPETMLRRVRADSAVARSGLTLQEIKAVLVAASWPELQEKLTQGQASEKALKVSLKLEASRVAVLQLQVARLQTKGARVRRLLHARRRKLVEVGAGVEKDE